MKFLFLVIIFLPMCSISATEQEQSWSDLQNEGVEKQVSFLSCGPAALSTLINQLTKIKIDPQDIMDKTDKNDEMHSFYDLMRVMDSYPNLQISYKAYKCTAEQLYKMFKPSLVNINIDGSGDHFVVFQNHCEKTDTVSIADPAMGNAKIPRTIFEKWFYSTTFSQKRDPQRNMGAVLYLWKESKQ